MIFGTKIIDKLVFRDGASFVNIYFSHNKFSNEFVIFWSYLLF